MERGRERSEQPGPRKGQGASWAVALAAIRVSKRKKRGEGSWAMGRVNERGLGPKEEKMEKWIFFLFYESRNMR